MTDNPERGGRCRVEIDDAHLAEDVAHNSPAGRELRVDESRQPYLAFLAFGVRHHPRDSNAPTVYEVAHRRLNAAKEPPDAKA